MIEKTKPTNGSVLQIMKTEKPNTDPLKNRREAAHELHISIRTLDTLLAARAIEHIRINGAVRFSAAGLEKFKLSRTVTAAA